MPPIYATLAAVIGADHRISGVLSGLSARPPDPSVIPGVLMVSAHLLSCRLSSPPFPRRPGCGCPTCCTPPTAAPTTCCPAATTTCCRPAALPTRRPLVHPAARRRRTRRLADQLGAGPVDRTARPRRLARCADRGVRRAARNALGRRGAAAPTPAGRRSGRLPAGLGARRGVGARTRSRRRRAVDADAERARLLAAADGDVVLRGDRPKHAAPQAHRAHRRTGG